MHGIVHVLIGIVINYWKLLLWHSPNSMDNNGNAKKGSFCGIKIKKKVASFQGIKNLEQQDSEPHQKKTKFQRYRIITSNYLTLSKHTTGVYKHSSNMR